MQVPFLRGLKKPLQSSNKKSLINWRVRKWLKAVAAAARVAQVRVLAVRAGLVAVVQPRDPKEGTGPVPQGIHQAVGAVTPLVRVNAVA